ncbi:hypothetical protein C3L33_23152, partial [Rhododendron williamsianum]
MLLGKRPRPPIKRTTSMTEFTLDLTITEAQQPSDPLNSGRIDQRFLAAAAVSPRNHRRNSADFIETAHFLRSCFLCKCRLVPGRDIYMYRGDSAFCSLECRQQQIIQDEKKEKCSLASMRETPLAASQGGSAEGETVAAV